jgi:ubiquinone/menaquinone biosynthesis C-methylase UbiE
VSGFLRRGSTRSIVVSSSLIGCSPTTRVLSAALFSSGESSGVLEVGCGMGLHSECLSKVGAQLMSIDISETSIEVTRRRLLLKNPSADIRQMDAQVLQFPDRSFEFVWSWGVIHHWAVTGRIVREIHRVLRPRGETRVTVYNLEGMPAYISMARRYIFGFWRRRTLDDCLWRDTDGFTGRYYSKDQFRDLFNTFFSTVDVQSLVQDADAAPLPRYLRPALLRLIRLGRTKRIGNARGGFLFATATK